MNTTTNLNSSNVTNTSAIGISRVAFHLGRLAIIAALALTVVLAVGARRVDALQQGVSTITPLNDPVDAGDWVDVVGDGFEPGEFVSLDFGGWTIANTVAAADGTFFASGMVDSTMPAGAHPLDANGDMGSWATTSLTVTAPAPVVLNPYVGAFQMVVGPGGFVDGIGGDFQPYENVTVFFGGSVLSSVSADANGEFYFDGSASPSLGNGFHRLEASGDWGSYAGSDVEVSATANGTPSIASAGSAPQGGVATIFGDGFVAHEVVWISFGGLSDPVTADANGSFAYGLPIANDMPAGGHPVDAYGDVGSWAGTDQVVDPKPAAQPQQSSQPQSPSPQPQQPTQPSPSPSTGDATASQQPAADTSNDDQQPADDDADESTEQEEADESVEVTEDETSDTDETPDADETPETDETPTVTVVEDIETQASDDEDSSDEQAIEIDPADGESNGLSMVLFALGGLALAGTGAGVGLMVARRRS
jgi:hypothetical protein